MLPEWVEDCVAKKDIRTQIRKLQFWLKHSGESFALMCVGVIMIMSVVITLYQLFTSAPIITEEAELVTRVTQRVMQGRCEWTAPESWNTQMHLAAMSSSVHIAMYKLKVIVIVDALRLHEMKRVLNSLTNALYNNREHSIDLQVIVLNAHRQTSSPLFESESETSTIQNVAHGTMDGSTHHDEWNIKESLRNDNNNNNNNNNGVTTQTTYSNMPSYEHILDHVHWPHGRYEVLLRDERATSQLLLSELWYPTSLWELVLFLDDTFTLSRMWYFYFSKMIAEYIAEKSYYNKYIELNKRTAMSDILMFRNNDDLEYNRGNVGKGHAHSNKRKSKSNSDNNNNNIDIIGFSLLDASLLLNNEQAKQGLNYKTQRLPFSSANKEDTNFAVPHRDLSKYQKTKNQVVQANNEGKPRAVENTEWMSLFPSSTGMATVYLPYFWRQWLYYFHNQTALKYEPHDRRQQQQHKLDKTATTEQEQEEEQTKEEEKKQRQEGQAYNAKNIDSAERQWEQMNAYMRANDLYILYPFLPDRTQFAKIHSKRLALGTYALAHDDANDDKYDDELVNDYSFLSNYVELNKIPRYHTFM